MLPTWTGSGESVIVTTRSGKVNGDGKGVAVAIGVAVAVAVAVGVGDGVVLGEGVGVPQLLFVVMANSHPLAMLPISMPASSTT